MCTVWFCLLLKPVFLARLFICKDCKNPLNLIWESESLLQKRRAPPGVIIARSGNGRWFGTMAAFGESVCSQSLSRASWFLICIVPICCVDVLCSYSLPFPPPSPISYVIFFQLPYRWYLAITAFPISDFRIVPDAKWGFGFKWLENHLINSAHLSNQASQESGHLMKCLPCSKHLCLCRWGHGDLTMGLIP